MLKIVDINQNFDGQLLFKDDVNLEIKPNELTLLYGDNGGGKSSIFEVFSFLTAPSQGEVFWDGEKISSIKHANSIRSQYMSIQFSDHKLISQLNIKDNITLPVMLCGQNDFQDQWDYLNDALLNFSNMENSDMSLKNLIQKENVCKLSDGEKKIVLLARTLLLKTPYVLADEMLNGFTEELKVEVWTRLLSYFNQNNMGVFLIEHWDKAKEYAENSTFKTNSFKIINKQLSKVSK